MKMFFGGSAAFAATLLSASVLFYAKPLFAEGSGRQPASVQQEKKDTTAEVASAEIEKVEPPEASNSSIISSPPNSATAATPKTSEAPSSGELTATTSGGEARAAEAISPPQAYVATAYSLPGRTASGMRVAKGVIAADPRVLPLGTRVRLDAGPYSGEYIVADTGSAVRGRKIDVWVPSYREACRFGRRNIRLSVLSYGVRRGAAARRRAARRAN